MSSYYLIFLLNFFDLFYYSNFTVPTLWTFSLTFNIQIPPQILIYNCLPNTWGIKSERLKQFTAGLKKGYFLVLLGP